MSVGLGLGLVSVFVRLLWSPYVIGQTVIFLPCDFYLSFFPCLISAVGDWMSTILPLLWVAIPTFSLVGNFCVSF